MPAARKVVTAAVTFGGEFAEPLRIKEVNRRVTEAQCRRCHAAMVTAMDTGHAPARRLPCLHCHGPASMQLRITRPAFMEGIRALKARQGIADYDVNRDATRQEMRSFVCGQCHVEDYFKGAEKRLVYPWARGHKVEDMLA